MFKLAVLIAILSVGAVNGRVGPPINAAEEARRMVHMSNWASVLTITTNEVGEAYPMVNVVSMADSKVDDPSTGNVYFLMTDSDITAMDTKKNNKVTFMFTESQDGDCEKRGLSPWSFLCMRTMLTGTVKKMEKGTAEYKQGMDAFYSRHPNAVKDEEHYLCKLDITKVLVYGWGGNTQSTPEEYMAGTDAVIKH